MKKYKDIILSFLVSLAIAVILFIIIYAVVQICDDSVENQIVLVKQEQTDSSYRYSFAYTYNVDDYDVNMIIDFAKDHAYGQPYEVIGINIQDAYAPYTGYHYLIMTGTVRVPNLGE